jgi:microsomal dipeptidase-like Zn-dependent dipeptidase
LIADLHCHYPMHLEADPDEDPTLEPMVKVWRRRHPRDWLRALLLDFASRKVNYRSWSSGHRVDIPKLRDGNVRVAFSVLLDPETEFDPRHWYGPPQSEYVGKIKGLLEEVELVVSNTEDGARVVKSAQELDDALDAGDVALVHCIEGGFQLGADEAEIEATVAELAGRGVVYVVLAHLFWRRVAGNSNAFPFLTDKRYHHWFPEPPVGLTHRGKAAVRAMARNRVLIDLSHMSQAAIDSTFAVLDDCDRELGRTTPVLATHVGARQGENGLDYNLDRATVEKVAARGGVVGMIMGDHIMCDGLRPEAERGERRTKDFDDSFEVLVSHIDTVNEWSGNPFRHVGIGTDLDGFIKPTLAEIETAWDMARVELALARHYGQANAELICSGNALRLLREYVWAG